MRKFKITAALLIAVITGMWFHAEAHLLPYDNFFQWRAAFVQYSGMIAVTLMSLTMLLALRLPLIEQFTRGLDKSYRLHKWTGIAAVSTGAVHWLIAIVPKYLVGAGLLERPIKGGGPNNPDSFYALVKPLRGLAEQLGELAFYTLVVLSIVAVVGLIRYKGFKLSHKLMSVAFLVIAFHSAILIKHSYWPYPITYFCLTLIAAGSLAAVYSLLGRIGKSKHYLAKVASFNFSAQNKVVDLQLNVPRWRGHHSGQFAFVQFPGEEPHPFTIASAYSESGNMRFMIKELGDFTSTLKNTLSIGQAVKVEGPYGCFNFSDPAPQLWLAGGIGIAAFKAILEERQSSMNNVKTDLYYCTDTPDEQLIDELQQQAVNANVTLTIVDKQEPLLCVETLQQQINDLLTRKIWFCGPVKFSAAIKRDLSKQGYNLAHYHEELFEMR
ncbi:ferredoxin reductase family protein [Agarivorans sp. MS3-6]